MRQLQGSGWCEAAAGQDGVRQLQEKIVQDSCMGGWCKAELLGRMV